MANVENFDLKRESPFLGPLIYKNHTAASLARKAHLQYKQYLTTWSAEESTRFVYLLRDAFLDTQVPDYSQGDKPTKAYTSFGNGKYTPSQVELAAWKFLKKAQQAWNCVDGRLIPGKDKIATDRNGTFEQYLDTVCYILKRYKTITKRLLDVSFVQQFAQDPVHHQKRGMTNKTLNAGKAAVLQVGQAALRQANENAKRERDDEELLPQKKRKTGSRTSNNDQSHQEISATPLGYTSTSCAPSSVTAAYPTYPPNFLQPFDTDMHQDVYPPPSVHHSRQPSASNLMTSSPSSPFPADIQFRRAHQHLNPQAVQFLTMSPMQQGMGDLLRLQGPALNMVDGIDFFSHEGAGFPVLLENQHGQEPIAPAFNATGFDNDLLVLDDWLANNGTLDVTGNGNAFSNSLFVPSLDYSTMDYGGLPTMTSAYNALDPAFANLTHSTLGLDGFSSNDLVSPYSLATSRAIKDNGLFSGAFGFGAHGQGMGLNFEPMFLQQPPAPVAGGNTSTAAEVSEFRQRERIFSLDTTAEDQFPPSETEM